MKQLRQTIFGAALILSGSIGIALGNLEETIYHSGRNLMAIFFKAWLLDVLGVPFPRPCCSDHSSNETKKEKPLNYPLTALGVCDKNNTR